MEEDKNSLLEFGRRLQNHNKFASVQQQQQRQREQQPQQQQQQPRPVLPEGEDPNRDEPIVSERGPPSTFSSEEDSSADEMGDRPTRAYVQPPTYSAKKGEDATEWLKRYEKVSTFNNWDEPRRLASVQLFLTDGAQDWAESLTKQGKFPTGWNQVPVPGRPQSASTEAIPAVPPGFKQVFEREFLQGSQSYF